MTQANTAGEGFLNAIVWPAYAGAVKDNGDEPMFDYDYERGQIHWDIVDGKLIGSTKIKVPKGKWSHIIYCRNQFKPGFVVAAKLEHPIVVDHPDTIDLFGITEQDVVFNPHQNIYD
jgi:hypothetical protein